MHTCTHNRCSTLLRDPVSGYLSVNQLSLKQEKVFLFQGDYKADDAGHVEEPPEQPAEDLPSSEAVPDDGEDETSRKATRAAYMRFLRRMSNPKTMKKSLIDKFNNKDGRPARVVRSFKTSESL
jgi:hypothetical protein